MDLKFTGERFVPLQNLVNDEIGVEHLHRYHAAVDLVRNQVVLDLASGEGFGTAILASTAKKVYGIDIDAPSIEHARDTYGYLGNTEFIQAGADKIPLEDGAVDIVVSFETIEHLNEDTQKKFLQEIKRVLKKDGKLIISTPDKVNYTERYDHKNEFHLKEFNRDEFYGFLKRYFDHVSEFLQGFEIISAITEPDPAELQNIKIANWNRAVSAFSRKYLISVCSNAPLEKNLNFSSVVFQVHKDYLQVTDRIVEMEAHILELGEWGHRLDSEVSQRNELIRTQKKQLDEQAATIAKLETEKNQFGQQLLEQQNTISRMEKLVHEFEQWRGTTQSELKRKTEELASQAAAGETARKEAAQLRNENEQLKARLKATTSTEEKLRTENTDQANIIQEQKHKIHTLHQQIDVMNGRLNEIYASEGWKLLSKYYNLKGKLLPEDSERYRLLKKTVNRIRGKKDPFAVQHNQPVSHNNQPHQQPAPAVALPEVPDHYEHIAFPVFENPAVSIVLPAYNGWHLTYKCLQSIRENTTDVSYEVIIADDASTDETKNISEHISNIVVVRNEKNLEFLHNCNNAARYSKGKYILFLNNDTEVKPNWLGSMTELMERDETIGMVGSKLIYPNGRLQEAGGIIWNDASGWNFGHKADPDAPEFNYVKEVDYISGASIIIRTGLWEKIGGFDNLYTPAYCEDSDLAFEVRKHGYKVIYQPLSEVIHFEGYTHGSDTGEGIKGSEIKAYQKLNNQKFREKWRNVLETEHFPNGENVFWARDKSQNKKTILVVDHYVPQFDKDAGSRTVFQYLKLFVSLNMNVKFIGDNFYRHEPYTTILQQMGIEVLYGPWYAANWQQWVEQNGDKFDFVLLNRPHITIKYIDFIKKTTEAKILYYGHDLHFARELKQYEVEGDPKLLESSRKWKETETYIFNNAHVILTPSDDEKQQIAELVPAGKIESIRPYIFEKMNEPIKNFSGRNRILFVGGFTHKPNVDAVLWFVKDVWPLVLNVLPDAHFTVVGSNAPMEILQLDSGSVSVKGFLSDDELDSIYRQTRITVVPLRYGAGVKGKTVEALQQGIPVVSTSFGVEGLPWDSSFLEAADTAEDFARQIIELYHDEKRLTDLSRQSIDYIKANFTVAAAETIMKGVFDKAAKISTNAKALLSGMQQ